MRWLAIISFLFIFSDTIKSQNTNLVLNPSFENFIVCPTNENGGFYFINIHLPDWNDSIYGTPDYFNTCSPLDPSMPWLTYPVYGVPRNGGGFQEPKNGNAYSGILTYYPPQPQSQEYLVSEFSSPLKIRTTYEISFYCNLANNALYSTSKLGILISDNLPLFSDNLQFKVPQIINDSENNPLTDTVGWTFVHDTFEALGGEKYLVIGNFNNAANSDTAINCIGSFCRPGAYYYIDDVSVIELDTSTGIKESSLMHFQIYPNPAQNSITINNKASASVSIYSLSGVLLFTQAIKKEEPIDIGQLPNGVYFVAVENRREKLVVCK